MGDLAACESREYAGVRMKLPVFRSLPASKLDRFAVQLGLLLALSWLLYGWLLGVGYLADDFLFLGWRADGLGTLLRRVTVDSQPQMLRPLPVLLWGLPGGAALLHALSLSLHGLAGALVARLAIQQGAPAGAGLALGALFVAFPLSTEPVVWLSSSFDLWATVFALAALLLAGPTSIVCLVVALLCKESVVTLPAVALLLAPSQGRWRRAAIFGVVVAGYLAVRWAIFGGVGGYLDPEGRSLALAIDPWLFLRNVFLQLPYRVLTLLKGAPWLWLAVSSAALLGTFAFALGLHRRRAASVRALLAFLVVALPAASVFSIDVDHENARFVYLPLAVALGLLGGAVARPARGFGWVAAALAGLWSMATVVNGTAWHQAGREIDRTLTTLEAIQPRFPSGSVVLVDGHDTWHGAYVWRNGFTNAVRRAGLRADLDWRLGTAALLARPEELGTRAFEIEVPAHGGWIDWAPCQTALQQTTGELTRALLPAGGATSQLPWVEIGPLAGGAGAVVLAARSPLDRALDGRLWWRQGTGRFRVTDSTALRIPAGSAETRVRLPAGSGPWSFRLELADPRRLAELAELRLLSRPPACMGSV